MIVGSYCWNLHIVSRESQSKVVGVLGKVSSVGSSGGLLALSVSAMGGSIGLLTSGTTKLPQGDEGWIGRDMMFRGRVNRDFFGFKAKVSLNCFYLLCC